jgi:hypothetical protein
MYKDLWCVIIMLFIKSDGTYIEINKANYNNDNHYYRAITKARGHTINTTPNNINDKLADIVKHK